MYGPFLTFASLKLHSLHPHLDTLLTQQRAPLCGSIHCVTCQFPRTSKIDNNRHSSGKSSPISVIVHFSLRIYFFFEYRRLRRIYDIFSMSNPGRGFGLRPRQGRNAPRQKPSQDRWITVNTTSPAVRSVEWLDGPVPTIREKVERKFTT